MKPKKISESFILKTSCIALVLIAVFYFVYFCMWVNYKSEATLIYNQNLEKEITQHKSFDHHTNKLADSIVNSNSICFSANSSIIMKKNTDKEFSVVLF